MSPETKAKIDDLVAQNKILVFMKGNKLMPQCGFSNNVVQILNTLGAPFETVDVLEDPAQYAAGDDVHDEPDDESPDGLAGREVLALQNGHDGGHESPHSADQVADAGHDAECHRARRVSKNPEHLAGV